MKNFVLALFLVFSASLMRADSISFVGTSGWANASGSWFNGSLFTNTGGRLDFALYNPVQGGIPGNTAYSGGGLYGYTGTFEFGGSLTNVFYSAKTQTLTGHFSGWDYNLGTNQYNGNVTGVFTDKMSLNNYGGILYGSSRGSLRPNAVPEPGTLGLLGTGLLMIGSMSRRRLTTALVTLF